MTWRLITNIWKNAKYRLIRFDRCKASPVLISFAPSAFLVFYSWELVVWHFWSSKKYKRVGRNLNKIFKKILPSPHPLLLPASRCFSQGAAGKVSPPRGGCNQSGSRWWLLSVRSVACSAPEVSAVYFWDWGVTQTDRPDSGRWEGRRRQQKQRLFELKAAPPPLSAPQAAPPYRVFLPFLH